MQVPVFKSLCKPMFWGGLPRLLFIFMFLSTMVLLFFFRTFRVLVPVGTMYFILVAITQNDHRIFGILWESFHIKSHYF